MPILIAKLLLGIIILLLATQKLVKSAENLSSILKISPLIIGTTVVALATSLPELTVSFISVLRGDSGLAVGNMVGSNIINVLLVLPVGILAGGVRIGTKKTQRNAYFILMATITFFLSQFIFPPLSGLILLALMAFFSISEYRLGVFGRKHEDHYQLYKHPSVPKSSNFVFLTIASILGVIAGGIIVVDSIETISAITRISTSILGFTVTAIATSLPELLATIYSQRDHQDKITVGNIIGSNIYNLLLIGGVISFFTSMNTINPVYWLWLFGTTLSLFGIIKIYKGKRPAAAIGIILILLFIAYIATIRS